MLELKSVKELREVLNCEPAKRDIWWSYWLIALSLNTAYGSAAIWIMLDQISALVRYALILCCAGLPWVFYMERANRRAYLREKALRTRLLFRNLEQEMRQSKTPSQPPAFFVHRNNLSA